MTNNFTIQFMLTLFTPQKTGCFVWPLLLPGPPAAPGPPPTAPIVAENSDLASPTAGWSSGNARQSWGHNNTWTCHHHRMPTWPWGTWWGMPAPGWLTCSPPPRSGPAPAPRTRPLLWHQGVISIMIRWVLGVWPYCRGDPVQMWEDVLVHWVLHSESEAGAGQHGQAGGHVDHEAGP